MLMVCKFLMLGGGFCMMLVTFKFCTIKLKHFKTGNFFPSSFVGYVANL